MPNERPPVCSTTLSKGVRVRRSVYTLLMYFGTYLTLSSRSSRSASRDDSVALSCWDKTKSQDMFFDASNLPPSTTHMLHKTRRTTRTSHIDLTIDATDTTKHEDLPHSSHTTIPHYPNAQYSESVYTTQEASPPIGGCSVSLPGQHGRGLETWAFRVVVRIWRKVGHGNTESCNRRDGGIVEVKWQQDQRVLFVRINCF